MLHLIFVLVPKLSTSCRHIGVMSGALLFVSEDLKLSTSQQEIVVGSLNLVLVLGGALEGRLSVDAIERQLMMLVAAAIFFVGAALLAFKP